MKILFLTDNFPPEYNAPATRTYEHCREWVRQGAEVTVITCVPNFPKGEVFEGYKNRWKQSETIDGIKVIRVWSFISPNKGTLKRAIDFLSFAVTAILSGLSIKCDVIVATSPQFFTAVAGYILAVAKRKKWIMEVRDLWPESIKAVDAVSSNWVISILGRIELFLYRHAHRIVVVTDSFKANIVKRGTQPERIFVIKNGVDISIYQPKDRDHALMDKYGLHGKFVIGYAGTHGLAHNLSFVVRSIERLNDESFHFLFIGDGAEKDNVVKLATELKLQNITFIDPVPKAEIQDYISTIDVALVPLKKSLTFESVIPSKVFEFVAMNKPILCGVNGETRSMIESYNTGLYFEPENESDFIDKLKLIRKRMTTDNACFLDGCHRMARDFDRNVLAKRMLETIAGSS